MKIIYSLQSQFAKPMQEDTSVQFDANRHDQQNTTLLSFTNSQSHNTKLSVFDSHGKLIFHVKNYQNNWDGKINGETLPDGTYYYVLDFNSPNLKQRIGFLKMPINV